MQESPGARSLVSGSEVIGWKYNAKRSWAKPEEPRVRQCARCHAESSPARIIRNLAAERLPSVKRLFQMSRPRHRDQCQKNGKSARERDAFLCARQVSKKRASELRTDGNEQYDRDYQSHARGVRQDSGNGYDKKRYGYCAHAWMRSARKRPDHKTGT